MKALLYHVTLTVCLSGGCSRTEEPPPLPPLNGPMPGPPIPLARPRPPELRDSELAVLDFSRQPVTQLPEQAACQVRFRFEVQSVNNGLTWDPIRNPPLIRFVTPVKKAIGDEAWASVRSINQGRYEAVAEFTGRLKPREWHIHVVLPTHGELGGLLYESTFLVTGMD